LRGLRTGVDLFRRRPDLPKVLRGPLPAARKALKPFPQLGETGAHRMLLFAADHPTIPVDARISRTALRLGYGEPSESFRRSARSVQAALTAELPPAIDVFRRAAVYLSHHGGATCTESEPHCGVCPLLDECVVGQARTRGAHEPPLGAN
jgi:endonuclease-3